MARVVVDGETLTAARLRGLVGDVQAGFAPTPALQLDAYVGLSRVAAETMQDWLAGHGVLAGVLEEAWRCAGCGSAEGRYDGGAACERCVLDSFAESG